MAITITYKSSIYQTTNTAATAVCTPTWTPAANAHVIAFVCTTYSASPTDPTSVTGHGLSYTALTLGTSTLSTTHKLSVWVAKTGAAPSSAACTANTTTTNGTGALVIEFEVTGAVNAATAVQAIVASTATNTATSTNETVTLAASSNSGENRAMIFGVQLSNTNQTAAGSWTLTAGAVGNFNTPATGGAALFNNSTFDTAGAATGANVAWRMIGIEIAGGEEATDPEKIVLSDVAFGVGTASQADSEALRLTDNNALLASVAPTDSSDRVAASDITVILVSVTGQE